MRPLVIIPARVGSQGVKCKNFRTLPDGSSLVSRAVAFGRTIGEVVVTTDAPTFAMRGASVIRRSADLSTATAAMGDVVRDALECYVTTEPAQPIVLLQPTTPFRSKWMVSQCLSKLPGCELVMTVHPVPETYRPDRVLVDDGLQVGPATRRWAANRQQARPAYVPDGGCYVFRRDAAEKLFDFTRLDFRIVLTKKPLLNVNTREDWQAVCAAIRARHRFAS